MSVIINFYKLEVVKRSAKYGLYIWSNRSKRSSYKSALRRLKGKLNSLRSKERAIDMTDLDLAQTKEILFGSGFALNRLSGGGAINYIMQKPRINKAKEIIALNKGEPLNLSGLSLIKLPNEVGMLCNLTSLRADDNRLNSLPLYISELKRLQYLHLTNNCFFEFPSEVLKLNNLRELWIEDNKINSIPSDIAGMQSISSLYISRNEMVTLPSELGNLPHLDWVQARGNNFDKESLNTLKLLESKGVHVIHEFFDDTQ